MLLSLDVPNEQMQKFVRNMEVRQSMGQYVDMTTDLFDKTDRVKPDSLMEVAYYALMALNLLNYEVYIEPELEEVKEKITGYLADALEEAGFDIC